ncbi:MAG: hypothetical protein FWG91_01775 [Lachnospiraceae bacterium]|nr:hypothetical protein [Lachnospiraceae bacterium]
MKRKLSLLLALVMVFSVLVACGSTNEPVAEPAPVAPAPAPEPAQPEPEAMADSFLWENFEGRDPANKPDLANNGASMWWDNWANLRANVDNGIAQISFRPGAFDPEDFDDEDDYFARAADWMGNWGQAVDMWSLEGIAWTKYLTIRMSGADGGEENKLILHFQPEDGPSFVKLFSELVTKDGGNASITTDMQDIVIDLEASGFPGMTNRMHIRALAPCVVYFDEMYFSGPIGPIGDDPVSEITVSPIGNPADLPIKDYVEAVN